MEAKEYAGHRAIPAPNRYRKLLKPMLSDLSNRGVEGSAGASLFFASDGGHSPQWKTISADIVAMQKAEWPQYEGRAIGMEPTFDLTDVILIWEGPSPVILNG